MIMQLTTDQVLTFKLKVGFMVDSIEVSEFSNSKFKAHEYIKELFKWVEMKEDIIITDEELYNGYVALFNLIDTDVRKTFNVQVCGDLTDHLNNTTTLTRNTKSVKQFMKLFTITPTEFKRMIPDARKYLTRREEEYLFNMLKADGITFKSNEYEVLLTNGDVVKVEAISFIDAISKANLIAKGATAFKYKELSGTKWSDVNKNSVFNKYRVILANGFDRMNTVVRVPEGLDTKGIKKYIESELRCTYSTDMKIIAFDKYR